MIERGMCTRVAATWGPVASPGLELVGFLNRFEWNTEPRLALAGVFGTLILSHVIRDSFDMTAVVRVGV